jgi:capsular exopolysaccharide synthesis family protein
MMEKTVEQKVVPAEVLEAQAEAPEVSLRDYIRIVLKHVWVIVAFFVVVVTAVTIHTFRLKPVYQAKAQINIRRESPSLNKIQDLWNFYATQREYMETQYRLIASKRIARKAFDKLGLEKDPAFQKLPKPVVAFQSGIRVEPLKDTFLVDVIYEGEDPKKIARWVNEIVQVYIDYHNIQKTASSLEAERNIAEEMPKIEKKLRDAEEALFRFQEENKILSFEDEKDILYQNLAEYESALRAVKRERIDAEVQFNTVARARKGNMPLELIPEVQKNKLIQQLKIDLVRQEQEYLGDRAKYRDTLPRIKQAKERLELLLVQYRKEVENVVNEISERYKEIVAKETKLKAERDAVRLQLRELQPKQALYQKLQTTVEQNRTIYNDYSKIRMELETATSVNLNEIILVDPADVPTRPVKPNRLLNITMAILVGLLGGVGLAFFLEYVDDSVKGPEDVERYLRTPLLGVVPRFGRNYTDRKRDLVSIDEPKSTISELFRSARTGILFSSAEGEPRSLLIWSAGSSEGKTMVATNLAVTMAQAKNRILLVDADLRRPRVHKTFNLGNDAGLSTYLSGQQEVDDLLHETEVENLSVLPAGPAPPDPSELLGSARMKSLLGLLRMKFDRIIIDSAPALAVTDAALIGGLVDGIVQVVASSKVSRKLLVRGIEQMTKVGGNNLGAILNMVKAQKGGYYYSGYYYYAGYYAPSRKSGEGPSSPA